MCIYNSEQEKQEDMQVRAEQSRKVENSCQYKDIVEYKTGA